MTNEFTPLDDESLNDSDVIVDDVATLR